MENKTADELIEWLETMGFHWDIGHTGGFIEARIWDWPNVIGRYRPHEVERLATMIAGAMKDAGIEIV